MENKAIRALICDDSAFIRMMVSDILGKNGFEVVGQASDGKQAVEFFRQLRPDVMLLDIVMPQMDGLEVARQVLDEDPRAAVVMMSELSTSAMIVDAIQLGARGFITKPFQPAKLLREVRQALGLAD